MSKNGAMVLLTEEIVLLRARVAELEAALRPFAHDLFAPIVPDNDIAFGGPMVRVGDYRRAAELLAAPKPCEVTS